MGLKKAVILAGGKGTRMGELTRELPKPMLPLNGQPLLAYHIEWLRRNHFEEVWITVNHLGDVIKDFFGDGAAFGINIRYFHEDRPLGTVGGVKALENELTDDFLVLYGDTVFDLDFERLLRFHREKQAIGTLVVHPNDHPYDSDLLDADEEGLITGFFPKPHQAGGYYKNLVNAAMYIFTPGVFAWLKKDTAADFGKDIFPKMAGKTRLFAYNTPEYIKDMGTPGRLEAVTRDLLSGKIARRSLQHRQKAIFIDRDGVINPDKGLICHHEDFELFPQTAEAVKKINQSDFLAIVVTNQPGIAKGFYDFEGLAMIHKKMDTLLGNQGAKIDALYFCPHHPEKGFPGERPEFKIVCECRKPGSGMLLSAAEAFNIDLGQSYIIGDHERDIIAGKNVGCIAVGVKTGHGLSQGNALPDHLSENILEAVQWILTQPAHVSPADEQI